MSAFHLDELKSLGVPVQRLTADSRSIQPGDTFVAYPGAQADGRRYITDAIARGASAVIWETHDFQWQAEWQVPNLGVSGLRQQAGFIADHVYGQPSQKLWMVGVTGTNGKTSCSHWLSRCFSEMGKRSALLGTLGNGFPEALSQTINTTPDALLLQSLLASYVEQGAQAAVMEVSSHALAQGRVNGVRYDVALLTNLTRDHLDYHGDMESYAAAKRKLFDWEHLKHAVLNLDDAFGVELAQQLQDKTVEVIGYGMTEAALKLAEQWGIRMVYGHLSNMDAHGLELQLHTSWGAAKLESRLIGRFNASNLLGSLAVLLASGMDIDAATASLGNQKAVPGRMQSLGGRGMPTVVVDYAHTPDALEKVLLTLREVTGNGKVICVFGCGGDRDRGKRPMMGTVASRFADVRIITSDNPRSESAMAIIDAIAMGMQGEHAAIEDRAKAIAHAVALAQEADTVLIAGKGHEDYQEIAGVRHPFSDVEIAHRALSMWTPGERWPS